MPSVSAVLSGLSSKQNHWHKQNKRKLFCDDRVISTLNAATRGKRVHQLARDYLRSGSEPRRLHREIEQYWKHLKPTLDYFDSDPQWAEGALVPELSYTKSQGHSCIWHDRFRYSGCPDWVGTMGGVKTVAEFKSASTPIGTSETTGWRKDLAFLQLAGYLSAWRSTTGDTDLRTGAVLCATPQETQLFILEGAELQDYIQRFHRLAQDYNRRLEAQLAKTSKRTKLAIA